MIKGLIQTCLDFDDIARGDQVRAHYRASLSKPGKWLRLGWSRWRLGCLRWLRVGSQHPGEVRGVSLVKSYHDYDKKQHEFERKATPVGAFIACLPVAKLNSFGRVSVGLTTCEYKIRHKGHYNDNSFAL